MANLFKILLSISLMVYSSASLRIPKPVVLDPPEIWLSSYHEMDSFRGIPADKRFRSQEQFNNDFASKNGSDFVIFDETRLVKFTCEAEYPITWKFPFPQQMDYTTFEDVWSRSFRLSEFTEDTPDPINTKFKTAIIISTPLVHFLSLNLTCSSVEIPHSQMESSIYIFLSTDKMAIENQGETHHVSLEPSADHSTNNPPLVLPCRPATPDIKLSLEKEIVTSILKRGSNRSTIQKSWKPVNAPGKDLSFDPKVGFTLQRGLLGNRIFGLYKCSVLHSSDDDNAGGGMADPTQFVLVNVSKSDSVTSREEDNMPFESRSFIHGDANVRMEQSTTGSHPALICCSGVKNKPPKLFVEFCNSPLNCELLKQTAMDLVEAGNEYEFQLHSSINSGILAKEFATNVSSDCSWTVVFGVSSIAVCKGNNVEFVEQYVDMFHPMAGGTVTNRSRRIQEADKLNITGNSTFITSLSRYEPLASAKAAPISQKILLTVGARIRRPRIDLSHFRYLSIFFINPKYYNDLGDTYGQEVFESDEILKSKINKASVHILEYHRDVYYEGEPLTFMCFGVKHFYTKKPHLRVNWSNGTKTLLDMTKKLENEVRNSFSLKRTQPHILYLSNNNDMFTGSGSSLVSIFGRRVIATREMSSVDCWMPLVNSSKWDKISKPVKVLPSVAPRFLEKEQETLYYYLGDAGNTVTCTLAVGLPKPGVAVKRDGRKLKLNWHLPTANDTSRLVRKNMGNMPSVTINIGIFNITHEHQTVVQCLAWNVNGTATRTITVFVLDKPNRVLQISLGIAGALCVLLVGLGVKHWRDKRIVHALRTNNNLS